MKVVLKKKNDQKKLYVLGGLALIAGYLLYSNTGGDQSPAAPARQASAVPATDAPLSAAVPRRGITGRASGEFRPTVKRRPEDRVDPNKVDPTLKLDLLAKVQGVTLEGGARNLFQFGVAAPVVPATPLPTVPKVFPNKSAPPSAAVTAAAAPPPPQAPPIPLKYYGFTNAKGEQRKKAFFLDGEDIIVAREGETVKSRYKIIRIGVNSIEMEDTQFNSKQTLPLEPELAG